MLKSVKPSTFHPLHDCGHMITRTVFHSPSLGQVKSGCIHILSLHLFEVSKIHSVAHLMKTLLSAGYWLTQPV